MSSEDRFLCDRIDDCEGVHGPADVSTSSSYHHRPSVVMEGMGLRLPPIEHKHRVGIVNQDSAPAMWNDPEFAGRFTRESQHPLVKLSQHPT